MIDVASDKAEQIVVAIQGKAWQLNDIAIGIGALSPDPYLNAVLAPQDSGQQRKRFDNVFVLHAFSQMKSPLGNEAQGA